MATTTTTTTTTAPTRARARRIARALALSTLLLAAGGGCHDFSKINAGIDAAPSPPMDHPVDVADAGGGDGDAAGTGCQPGDIPSGTTCRPEPVSCRELRAECPACASCGGVSCCAYTLVPGSTSFGRGYDGTSGLQGTTAIPGYAALSTSTRTAVRDFYLDRHEVTVGRFRKFLDHYPFTPQTDWGRRAGDVEGTGWGATWGNANAVGSRFWAASKQAMIERIRNGCATDTGEMVGNRVADWLTIAAGNPEYDQMPMTCVTWFEAYLFCIWDDRARLPFEVEWSYAAVGGDRYLPYPWVGSSGSESEGKQNANVDASGFALKKVGSYARPSLWDHYDLAGNAYEMMRDWIVWDPSGPPADSAGHVFEMGYGPAIRGGSFLFPAIRARTVYRAALPADTSQIPVFPDLGWRCARDPG